MLFPNFVSETVDIGEVRIHCRIGGEGPPLLLLHGCPQTHLMWHKLAPVLARQFTVIASDLRGYGASSKPRGLPDHSNYAFRAMAKDQVELMTALGFRRFRAVGHDRGARVLHRMALDVPGVVERLALLDILPTTTLYEHTDKFFARAYWEWFFFIQGDGFPEELLGSNPEAFLRYEIGALVETGVIGAEAWAAYLAALKDDAAIHGMCEDYRAGAGIDLEHDAADADRQIEAPVLILWGEANPVWSRFDMIGVWNRFAADVTGHGIRSGHYLAEEAPDEVAATLIPFLTRASAA